VRELAATVGWRPAAPAVVWVGCGLRPPRAMLRYHPGIRGRLSFDFDLFIPPRPSTNPSSLFLFYPEDEIIPLLVLIPRPVNNFI
jgi:hypothetical protein